MDLLALNKVLPSFTEFYWVFRERNVSIRFYLVLSSFTGFYLFSTGFTSLNLIMFQFWSI